jgi:hypothetical protein
MVTMDQYGLGISIYELLKETLKKGYDDMFEPAKELILMMSHPNPFKRSMPEKVLRWVETYLALEAV